MGCPEVGGLTKGGGIQQPTELGPGQWNFQGPARSYLFRPLAQPGCCLSPRQGTLPWHHRGSFIAPKESQPFRCPAACFGHMGLEAVGLVAISHLGRIRTVGIPVILENSAKELPGQAADRPARQSGFPGLAAMRARSWIACKGQRPTEEKQKKTFGVLRGEEGRAVTIPIPLAAAGPLRSPDKVEGPAGRIGGLVPDPPGPGKPSTGSGDRKLGWA